MRTCITVGTQGQHWIYPYIMPNVCTKHLSMCRKPGVCIWGQNRQLQNVRVVQMVAQKSALLASLPPEDQQLHRSASRMTLQAALDKEVGRYRDSAICVQLQLVLGTDIQPCMHPFCGPETFAYTSKL